MPPYQPPQIAAANHAPVAPYTWEVQAELARTVQDTGAIPIQWNRPVMIVGFYASVTQNSVEGGGLLVPTTDDICVSIGFNQEDRITNRLERTAGAALASQFVTLAAMSTQVPRLVELKLQNAAPTADVIFRWKNNTIATPIFEDAYCCLSFYCVYLN